MRSTTTLTRSDPTRQARRRRWLPLVLALALVTALLAPAIARAEIIDFDPETDEVPEVVAPPEIETIQQLQGAGYTYMATAPSPDGTWVYAYTGAGVGFLNLKTGALVEWQEDPFGDASQVSNMYWQDDTTLGMITGQMLTDADGKPTEWQFYRVTIKAPTGEVNNEAVGTMPPTVSPVDASPDLQWLLALEVPTGTVAAKKVTLRPSYGKPSPLPDTAPGVLGAMVPNTLELQQAPTRLALRALEGDARKELTNLPADTGLSGVTWGAGGGLLVVGTSTMPDWDGDRQRDNDPPAAGLPNLGSVNVQEALGNLKPEDNPMVTGNRLHVFDVDTGTTVKVLQSKDYPQGWLAGLSFAPDGAHALLVIANKSELDGRKYPVYSNPSGISYWLTDTNLAPTKQITGPGLDSLGGSAGWLDNGSLYFAVPDELDTRIDTYDLGTGTLKTVWGKPGSMWQVAAAGGKLVFPHATVDQPMEMWTADVANAEATGQPVTDAGGDIAAMSKLKTAEITWKASSGRTLTGLYVYREDMPFPPAKPGPVVVWQQGGPGGQMTNDFGSSVEAPYSLLPQFGIPVFMANAAGRTIQDAQFYSDMAEGRNFGQLDIQQVKEGVDALVARKIVDSKKVGITGCSYGGYFTLQSIRTYPGYYAAANAQCSLTDLFEEFTFGYTPFIAYLMGRAPQADPDEYLKDAPFYGAKDVTTPALLFHGRQDFLPVSLIANYHDELDSRDVEVTFLRVNNEQHGFGNPSSQLYAAQLQLKFFRDHLGVADTSPGGPQPLYLPIAYPGR